MRTIYVRDLEWSARRDIYAYFRHIPFPREAIARSRKSSIQLSVQGKRRLWLTTDSVQRFLKYFILQNSVAALVFSYIFFSKVHIDGILCVFDKHKCRRKQIGQFLSLVVIQFTHSECGKWNSLPCSR